MLTVVEFCRNRLLKEPLQASLLRILGIILPNKEHLGRFQGLGKHRTWTNTWSTAGTSQSKGFQNEVKVNFEKM